jgi:GNAT superfamily N-acetyltransferase
MSLIAGSGPWGNAKAVCRTGCEYVGVLATRRLHLDDLEAAVTIVRGLPDYFTDDVPEKIEHDAAAHEAWVLADTDDAVLGFAVADRRSTAGAEILWMAVASTRRGAGAGTILLNHLIEELQAEGVTVVEVKTLDPSVDYKPYEATRGFWEARGFVQVDTIDPLPGWQPGNPAAIYVAALRPTC